MIKNQKVMLQIPVRKNVAKSWRNIVKESGYSQEELFCSMFANMLNEIMKKGDKQDGKEDA